jgi:RND family efflux transporter MFP subunit
LDSKIRTRSIGRARRDILVGIGVLLIAAFAANPAWAERRLAFAVAGIVEEVMVRPGQKVAKGTALARLDLRPLAADARATEAALKAAAMELEFAAANLKRVKQLFDDLSTSKEEMEQATLRLARAEAGKESAAAANELAQWRLERGTLTAPVAGVVDAITGYIGLVVDPAQRFSPVVVMK